MEAKLLDLKEKGLAPEFLTVEAYQTLSNGYLQPGETPKDAYVRVSQTVALSFDVPNLDKVFFDLIWNNWLCLSTPVLANSGTKNLQISCFSGRPADDTYSIMEHITELAMLTKYGGGVGSSFSDLRHKGAPISKGGVSDGIVPFLKILEMTVEGIKQGPTRRGSVASYLNFEHGDIDEFLDIRKATGDHTRRCLSASFHNAVCISDNTMNEIVDSSGKYRDRWNKLMTNRVETGEAYILFTDNANRNCPDYYKGRITQSNLCIEIMEPVTHDETFVCCLSSLNLSRYREWKNWICPVTGFTAVELSVMFLDGVISNFIKQAKELPGLERSVRFAENHRAIGLGVLGWHTLLQQENIPFASFQAMTLNNEVFKKIREEADKMTLFLGQKYGECKETKGTGRRNTVTMALAPTMSNSILSGGLSQGIEPTTANLFVQKSAKGNFIKKNDILVRILQANNLDTFDVWEQINKDSGSVRNVKGLSPEDKNVFLTAREIDQFALVQQAAQRQRYVDQSQSLNLFFSLPRNKEEFIKVAKYINEVHLEAWRLGVKSLYYLKTGSPIKGSQLFVEKESSCLACEG